MSEGIEYVSDNQIEMCLLLQQFDHHISVATFDCHIQGSGAVVCYSIDCPCIADQLRGIARLRDRMRMRTRMRL